jgi:hypothetical protein
MIVVVPDHVNAADLAAALASGGFKIHAKPGGIFELVPAAHRRPVCQSPDCQDPASIVTRGTGHCARHALASPD